MAVCKLDENGYCARHRKVHAGRTLHWALSDSPYGEALRQRWDEMVRDPKRFRPRKGLCRHLGRIAKENGQRLFTKVLLG